MKNLNLRSALLLTSALTISTVAVLNIGYYETYWAEDNITVFFIKQEPTLQMKFENMFASDSDFDPVHELSDNDRQDLIDYCRYHLGFITRIDNEADRDACHKVYIDSFKN